MTKVCSRLLTIYIAVAGISNAQFLLRLRSDNADTYVASGGSATLNAKSRTSVVPFRVSLANRGTLPVTVLSTELTGPTDFSFVQRPTGSATLDAGQEFTVSFQYKATSDIRAQAQVLFTVQDQTTDGTAGAKNVYILTIAASAADLLLLRVTDDGNVVRVVPEQPVTFPLTQGAVPVIPFVIANRGATPGSALSIAIDSADYQLLSLPFLPQTVEAGAQLQFSVRYNNRTASPVTAHLTVSFEDTRTIITLQPQQQASPLTLFVGQGADAKAVPEGGEVHFPDTEANGRSELSAELRNTSGQPANLGFIAVGGSGFTLTDAPVVPVMLPPQGVARLKIAFEPKTAGPTTGTLRVNDATFALTGIAPGLQIKVSYPSGGSTVAVQPNDRIQIDPAAVGSSTKLALTVQNLSNQETIVTPVALLSGQTGFSIDNSLSSLTLSGNQTVQIGITFQPTSVGASEDTLRLGTLSYTLSSAGRNPPDLPSYRITFAPESPKANEQPSVSLILESAYPVALTGDLTLTATGNNAVADPAVLFSNGTRTVSFRIPANTTQAVFNDSSTSARFQTGTVAGTISIKPSFSTTNGFSVTPTDVPSATIAIAAAAPQLLSARLQDRTLTSFVVVVSGFTTARTLDKLNIQIGGSQYTVDLAAAAGAWFRNPTSQSFGSLFSIAFPVAGTTAAAAPASMSVNVTNEFGSSNTLQINTQ